MKRVLVAVACMASAAFAEETSAESADGEKAPVSGQAQGSKSVVSFTTIPLCRLVEGEAEIGKADGSWAQAEEGRFYPLGTSYRTGKSGRLVLSFGSDCTVSIGPESSFDTKAQPLGEKSRTIVLRDGVVELKMADNLPEGAFFVMAPGFTVKNPAGESRFAYERKGDGDEVTVRCVTGSLALDGRHFEIPVMRSANELTIRTSQDNLLTFLYGRSGDFVVRLDQGVRTKDTIDDNGQPKRVEEKGALDWHLSPATKVIISRAVPSIGSRMSVHTMAFDAAGQRKSECYFCENRAEVNSGELVAPEKADSEALAKRAAEATETAPATDVEETSADGDSEKTASDKNEEE